MLEAVVLLLLLAACFFAAKACYEYGQRERHTDTDDDPLKPIDFTAIRQFGNAGFRAPTGHRAFFTKVVGVTHANSDGTRRQDLLSRMKVGDTVEFIPEPNNPGDPNAIAVFWRCQQVGYLNKMRAEQITVAKRNYPAAQFWARVKNITGTDTKGVNIEVLCNGKVTVE